MGEKTSYDVAVIGGGPGGLTAAMYAVQAGYKVVVLEKLSAGGQVSATDFVDNYPGFDKGIDGFELGLRMQRGALSLGAEILFDEVTAVILAGAVKRIITRSKEIEARAVIISTGAQPRLLGLEGEKRLTGRGVAYCATCDGMRYRGKTVAVAGGGNTAVTDALYLARLCAKVYLVHRRSTLRAAKTYVRQLSAAGVETVFDSRVTRLLGDKQLTGIVVEGVKTGQERQIACDALFVAIGRVPDTGLLTGQIEMDEQGYITADETTRTSVENVFAVGDVRTKPVRQIVTAAADGAVAAHFIEIDQA